MSVQTPTYKQTESQSKHKQEAAEAEHQKQAQN